MKINQRDLELSNFLSGARCTVEIHTVYSKNTESKIRIIIKYFLTDWTQYFALQARGRLIKKLSLPWMRIAIKTSGRLQFLLMLSKEGKEIFKGSVTGRSWTFPAVWDAWQTSGTSCNNYDTRLTIRETERTLNKLCPICFFIFSFYLG